MLPAIERLGAGVLVVSFMPPALVRAFLAELPQPFPVVSDPDRKAYAAFALRRARWTNFLRPWVIWHYLKVMFRGWMPGRPAEGADLLQLGGDFVLDRQGNIVFGHVSDDAADRPTNAALLEALKRAKGA